MIYNNSTSFPPFVLKRCAGQCFFSTVGQIYSQSLSALFWSHWRGRWWLPHGHRTSAGKTTHSRSNKVQHTGRSSSIILSRAPANQKSPGCCSWQLEDLPMCVPVMNLQTPFIRLLLLQFSLVVLFWQVPQDQGLYKNTAEQLFRNSRLKSLNGGARWHFQKQKALQLFLNSANTGGDCLFSSSGSLFLMIPLFRVVAFTTQSRCGQVCNEISVWHWCVRHLN